MDTLHTVLRSIRGERKSRPDHLTVFREFLSQLERANRAPRPSRAKVKAAKATRRRAK